MLVRTSPTTASWLIFIGFGLFFFGFVIADSGYASMFGAWRSLPVITWMQLLGLSLALTGLTMLSTVKVRRNKWLVAVGMFGVLFSLATLVLFVAVPAVEIALGWYGSTTFDSLGLWLDHWQIALIIPIVGLAGAQALIWSAKLLMGYTRFQR